MSSTEKIRINKYLSSIGIASRRKVDQLLRQGQIEVNGQILTKPGIKIDPAKDKIRVSGEDVKYQPEFVYIALNKPKSVLSTTFDATNRKTVVDLVESTRSLYPVGRLDQDSHGLILLTNDGELAHRLTHPKFHIDKTYLVLVQGGVLEEQLEKLRNGILLKDGKTAPAKVKIEYFKDNRTLLEFIIQEGKYRQIRRMCGAVGLEVVDLKRLAMGPIKIGSLEVGESRVLKEAEIKALKMAVSLSGLKTT
jgi:23S rRNA pseudouridine2605 synthase